MTLKEKIRKGIELDLFMPLVAMEVIRLKLTGMSFEQIIAVIECENWTEFKRKYKDSHPDWFE